VAKTSASSIDDVLHIAIGRLGWGVVVQRAGERPLGGLTIADEDERCCMRVGQTGGRGPDGKADLLADGRFDEIVPPARVVALLERPAARQVGQLVVDAQVFGQRPGVEPGPAGTVGVQSNVGDALGWGVAGGDAIVVGEERAEGEHRAHADDRRGEHPNDAAEGDEAPVHARSCGRWWRLCRRGVVARQRRALDTAPGERRLLPCYRFAR
jgi:hypothetical protein